MKRFLICIIFMLAPMIYLFPQSLERITFLDVGDMTQRYNRTVNGVFLGWQHLEIKQEGNFLATYQTIRLVGGDWSEWTLESRRPMLGTLNEMYRLMQEMSNASQNAGTILNIRGEKYLRLFDTPSGRTRPVWWGTTGNSYNVFYKIYLVE